MPRMMRFLLTAGLAATCAIGASAQLQINGSGQPTVNAWDALTDAYAKTVKVEGCTDGDCSIEGLVLDNQAGGACLDNVLVTDRYGFDGRDVAAAEVALKIDADALAATRYYRAIVLFPRKGVQRLCVRSTMQASGMRFTVSLDRPQDADQLTQMARISTSANLSATELRLSPLTTPRRRMTMTPELSGRLARSLFISASRFPVSVSIQSDGPSLPIIWGDQSIGVTNRMLAIPATALREIQVTKNGAAMPIKNCAGSVDDTRLTIRC
ncbi:hypothetical protein FHS91_000462 [Sphingobium xanthum]|jgi:hypothetical protein|uniref:hypothetical protein n=1 Tax=Sphingobium xanthum TaxID=1387165 RepID=UPI001C8CF383|nr:hypothetical protein [Sphingobium xanthum]